MSDHIHFSVCPDCDEPTVRKKGDSLYCKNCGWNPLQEGFEMLGEDYDYEEDAA